MNKIKNQQGYLLAGVLLLLSCTLVWGSLFLLSLSDQYAGSDRLIAREQSQLLTRSGWNLALQQLETEGSLDALRLEQPTGTAQAVLERTSSGLIQLRVEGVAGGCHTEAQGLLQLVECPVAEPEPDLPDSALESDAELQEGNLPEPENPAEAEQNVCYQVQVLECTL